MLKEVAHRLKQARESAQLTIAMVEVNTDLSKGNISSWENAKFFPGAWALVQLSELYGVSVDWILKGKPSEMPCAVSIPPNQKIEAVFDLDLKRMQDILKNLLHDNNPHIRSWTIIQFEKAFAEACAEYDEKKLHA